MCWEGKKLIFGSFPGWYFILRVLFGKTGSSLTKKNNKTRWFNSWPFDPRSLGRSRFHHPKKVTNWITTKSGGFLGSKYVYIYIWYIYIIIYIYTVYTQKTHKFRKFPKATLPINNKHFISKKVPGFLEPEIQSNFFHGNAVSTWLGFAVTFVARPFGGVVLGLVGDIFGRKAWWGFGAGKWALDAIGKTRKTGWWQLKNLLFSPGKFGMIRNLTSIFIQMGWNHQLGKIVEPTIF